VSVPYAQCQCLGFHVVVVLGTDDYHFTMLSASNISEDTLWTENPYSGAFSYMPTYKPPYKPLYYIPDRDQCVVCDYCACSAIKLGNLWVPF